MSFIEHLLFHILFLLPNEHKRNKCVVVVDFGSWVLTPLWKSLFSRELMTRWTICTVLVKQGRHRSSATFFLSKGKRNQQNDKEVILQVKRDALIGEAEARKESTIGDLFIIVCLAPICISYIMHKLIALLSFSLFFLKSGRVFTFPSFQRKRRLQSKKWRPSLPTTLWSASLSWLPSERIFRSYSNHIIAFVRHGKDRYDCVFLPRQLKHVNLGGGVGGATVSVQDTT